MPGLPSLGFLGGLASRTSRPSRSPEPVARCPARGPPTVAERAPGQSDPGDATPEMRVAGNQGQGPGHNGAIVGLQSVDFQAAVPHPPSLLLPIPTPCQEVTKTSAPLTASAEGSRISDPTQDREGWAARCMVCYVHQVATEHHTSEVREGGKGRAAQSLIRAWGGTLPFLLYLKNQVRLYFSSPFTLRLPRSGISRALPSANAKMAVDYRTFP